MIRCVVRAAAGGAILVAAVVLSMAYGLVCGCGEWLDQRL